MSHQDTKLTASRHSTSYQNFNPNRSFISTAINNDSSAFEEEGRKSCIPNLPNYQKNYLGDDMAFIIVFQTIEIQRLSTEIQLLRVNLKEAHRQFFYLQNFQVQIRQLNDKCFAYESQIQELRQENQKLNKICQNFYHQNEKLQIELNGLGLQMKEKQNQKNLELQNETNKWKIRFEASQKSKSKELEQLKKLMQNQRKSMIDRQIREITIRFQNERSSLQSQIKKLKQMLNNRNFEIEDYKQKNQKYEIQMMQLKNYELLLNQHQYKFTQISNQLIKLTDVLRNRQDQIQAFKKRQYDLNSKLKDQKEWESDNKTLSMSIDDKNREIQEEKIEISRLDQEVVRAKQLIYYNNQLKEKINIGTKDLQRLNTMLRAKIDEIQEWKQKLLIKQVQMTQFKKNQRDLNEFQLKIKTAKSQNDRINGILKLRVDEMELCKKKNKELQHSLSNSDKDRQIIQEKFNKNIQNLDQIKQSLTTFESQNKILKSYSQRCKDLQIKNENISKEVIRLSQMIRVKDLQLDDDNLKLNKFDLALNDFKDTQINLDDDQSKIIILKKEIDQLRNLIKKQNQDISQLQKEKNQLYTSINVYKNYQVKMEQDQQAIKRLKNDAENHKNQYKGYQIQLKNSQVKSNQLQNNLNSMNNEREQIIRLLNNKGQQCDQYQNQINILRHQLQKKGQLQYICTQLRKKETIHFNDLENMEKKQKENQILANKEKNINLQLKGKLSAVSSQVDKLLSEVKDNRLQKSKQFGDLQQLYGKLLMKVKLKDNQIQMLALKITQFQSQCTNLKSLFQKLFEDAGSLSKQSDDLLQKIEEYQDYATRIHILAAQMDRLSTVNKELAQDNKLIRLKYSGSIDFQKKQQELHVKTVLMAVQIQCLRLRSEQRETSMDQMRKFILNPIRKI